MKISRSVSDTGRRLCSAAGRARHHGRRASFHGGGRRRRDQGVGGRRCSRCIVPFLAGSLDRHTLPALWAMNKARRPGSNTRRPGSRLRLTPGPADVRDRGRWGAGVRGRGRQRTPWRVADELTSASLYKHLPDKAASAIISNGCAEAAAALEAAVDGAADRGRLPDFRRGAPACVPVDDRAAGASAAAGLETRTAAPLVRAVGSPERARAAWAFISGRGGPGTGRFPTEAATWRSGIAAFAARPSPSGTAMAPPGRRLVGQAARIGSEPLSGEPTHSTHAASRHTQPSGVSAGAGFGHGTWARVGVPGPDGWGGVGGCACVVRAAAACRQRCHRFLPGLHVAACGSAPIGGWT